MKIIASFFTIHVPKYVNEFVFCRNEINYGVIVFRPLKVLVVQFFFYHNRDSIS